MNKAVISIILGCISFMFLGPFLSIPGLILGIKALKEPGSDLLMPWGHKGKVGKRQVKVQPFYSGRYIAVIALVINTLSILSTISILLLAYLAATQ